MTDVTVDRATDDERYVATDQLVWFDSVDSLSTQERLVGVPPEQRYAADRPGTDPGTYAGIYGVRPMELSLPAGDAGRVVPMAGLTWVGVHPDQRRRGVLSAMMRHHVEQTHREGVAISGLHASETAIYGRYGYGLASQSFTMSVGRGTKFHAPGLDDAAAALETRLATETGDALATRTRECELRVAPELPGTVVGAPDFYEAVLRELPEQLRDKEPRRMLFATRDGVDVGLAAFRRTHKWEQHRPNGTLEVHALIGGPAARLALLRRLVEFDLTGTVKLPEIAVDDPVLHWLGPRSASDVLPADNLWLRIVDLEAALPLRSYAADCSVVVELVDDLAPWQAGRWRITASGGEAAASRTDDAADVELPVAVLGGSLLGTANLVAMQHAGLVSEVRDGALAELWHAFRVDRPPVAALGF